MAHQAVLLGSQVRGSAQGTLKRWSPDPDSYIGVSNGILSEVALIALPDALGLSFDLDVEAAKDGIEYVEVQVSDNGTNWLTRWYKEYDPDTGPLASGQVYKFGYAYGWQHQYVKVLVRAKTAGVLNAGVKCFITDSIFGGSRLEFTDSTFMGFGLDEALLIDSLPFLAEGEIYNSTVTIAPQVGSAISPIDGIKYKKFDAFLDIVLNGWSSLSVITIIPEVKINGVWRKLSTQTLTGAQVKVLLPLEMSIQGVTGNFSVVTLFDGIAGQAFRVNVNGDVDDGTLIVRAILVGVK